MDDARAKFGSNLRALRKARALTQEALGELAGLDRSYVGGVERGERNPALTAIARLAHALDTSPSSLFAGIGEPPTGNGVEVVERGNQLILIQMITSHSFC